MASVSIDYKLVGASSHSFSQTIYFVACAELYQPAADERLKSRVSLRESAAGKENDLFSKLNDSTKKMHAAF